MKRAVTIFIVTTILLFLCTTFAQPHGQGGGRDGDHNGDHNGGNQHNGGDDNPSYPSGGDSGYDGHDGHDEHDGNRHGLVKELVFKYNNMYGGSSPDKSYLINEGGSNNPRRLALIIVFVLWNILLFCLAISGVAIANKNADDDSDSSSTTSCLTTIIPLYSALNAAEGSAVSLTSGGVVRLGGGTTIYKKQRITNVAISLSDYVVLPMSDNSAFLLWSDSEGYLHYSVGFIVDDLMSWGVPANTTYQASNLRGARLSQDLLLVASNVGIIAIVPQPITTIYMPQNAMSASTDTQICALSGNSFAVSWSGGGDYETAVGLVGGVVPTILWSNNTIDYSSQDIDAHSVACINTGAYLINYVTGSDIVSKFVTYDLIGNNITLGSAATLENANPTNFIKSATVSSFEAVVVYVDSGVDNSLVARVVSYTGDTILFGTSLFLNSGGSVEVANNEEDLIDVYPFVNGAFLVSFSDWANEDRVTTLIGQLTESGNLAVASPSYVISPANDNLLADQFWTKVVSISPTTFVNLYTLQNGSHALNLASSTGHVLNPPIGIITKLTTKDNFVSAVVGLNGQCKGGDIIFEIGFNYYCDSLGNLFPKSPSETPLYDYIDLNTVILSKNNIVGVGLTSQEVLIKTEVY